MNLYCSTCGQHQPVEEVNRCLEDDLKEHFYCKKCKVELTHEFEMEDNNLDDMQEAIDETRDLKRLLVMAENKFIKADEQYFACWNNHPINWEEEL